MIPMLRVWSSATCLGIGCEAFGGVGQKKGPSGPLSTRGMSPGQWVYVAAFSMDVNQTQPPPAAERAEHRKTVPRAARNASRALLSLLRGSSGIRGLLLALGGAGGLLMILSDLMTLYHVDVVTASCSDLADPGLADACASTGGEHHGYALLILGVLVLLMTWGAAVGRSTPAGFALVVLGAAGLAVALGVDLPDVHKTGVIGQRFAEASAQPGLGFWFELVGSGFAVLAGVVRLLRRERPRNGS